MKKHGVVYCLTDGKNKYIGSTFNFEARKQHHKHTEYLKKILNKKNHRYDIMRQGEFTKRELLDAENECIQNNKCINKKKPLTVFKNKQHESMLKWGKKYVHCDACNCQITRWNWCKHIKTISHKANASKNGEPVINGGKITYMRAVALYNKQKKEKDADHKHIVPQKGSQEQNEVIQLFKDLLNEENEKTD